MNTRTLLTIYMGTSLAVGCTLRPSEPPSRSVVSPRKNPHLSPRLSDERILAAMGFDPDKMKTRFAQGPDGYSTTYTTRDGDSVLITRSLVSGVFVMLTEPGGSKSWELGKP
jgi:hypothetical protein